MTDLTDLTGAGFGGGHMVGGGAVTGFAGSVDAIKKPNKKEATRKKAALKPNQNFWLWQFLLNYTTGRLQTELKRHRITRPTHSQPFRPFVAMATQNTTKKPR